MTRPARDDDGRVENPADEHAELRIPRDRLLHDWREIHDRACAYLAALGLPPEDRAPLASRAVEEVIRAPLWERGDDALAETLDAVERQVMGFRPSETEDAAWPERAFLEWRLRAAMAAGAPGRAPGGATPLRRRGALCSAPPTVRGTMAPNRFQRKGLRRAIVPARRGGSDPAQSRDRTGRAFAWRWTAYRRRILLTVLVLVPSVVASQFMLEVLPHRGTTWLEATITLCFAALFGWISIGLWTAVLGFYTLVRRRDPFALAPREEIDGREIDPQVRVALLMLICNEPVERVFAGLRAVRRSLERAGALDRFDIFVLSDSTDPGVWVEEEAAWFDWCREVDGFRNIHYRHRRARAGRKKGNVADFCRRWGRRYRYLITLDADSVMTGATLVDLVKRMEAHPDAGIIQTLPFAVNRRSLFARVQQFSSRVYGPMFAAGLHFWQLGDGQYWGHNAIIRIAPFMAHCALPRLPGKPPLGGEILSHDFVEAALMGKAGWTLWLAFDLEGSYEEVPSSLLEEMTRDRRWCQGNLQHLRIAFTRDLKGAHRALFLNGALSYVSAVLWFCFLALSTAEAVWEVIREPRYFPDGASLFPVWPVWRPDWAISLVAVTAAILFLPKFLGIALVLFRWRNARLLGGIALLTVSVLLEIAFSALFAPIRMVFHVRFVIANLLGRTVSWRSQAREDAETSWREALRHHGLDTVVASAWGLGVHWANPEYFWWLTPVVAALVLSVPLSVVASRVRAGDRARRWGLFRIPEESAPPPVLEDLARFETSLGSACDRRPLEERDGFVRAAVDPYVNALHALLLRSPRPLAPEIRLRRRRLRERALAEGPAALSTDERRSLLVDPLEMGRLHREVWRLRSREPAEAWGRPGRPASERNSAPPESRSLQDFP